MMPVRIEKLNTIAETNKLDAFLITSAASVKYLSGYYFYFEYGSSPFQLLPAALFLIPEKTAALVIADNELHQSEHVASGITIKPYASYVYETPLEFTRQFLMQLQEVFKQSTIGNDRIGVEKNSLPFAIAESLLAEYPKIEFVDITPEISSLRAVKDSDEIELIRQAAQLSDIGQASVLTHAKPGISELELFHTVRHDMEASVNTRVALMADFSSGSHTASGGGMPTGNIINPGDLILSDFTPCLNGYWGDSCSTIVVGTPTAEQKRIFTLVKEALDMGMDAIRPGVMAKEVDGAMRKHLEKEGGFGHHGGHGVGTAYHEEPRIVPYKTMILQPGMVIALEPAVYKNDFGIRLEHLMVVTQRGCEVLTRFNHRFEQA